MNLMPDTAEIHLKTRKTYLVFLFPVPARLHFNTASHVGVICQREPMTNSDDGRYARKV